MEFDDEAKRGNAAPPQTEGGGKRAAASVKDNLLGDIEDIEFDLIDEEEVEGEDTLNDVFARDTAIPAPPDNPSLGTFRPEEEPEEEPEEVTPKGRNHPKVPAPPPMRQSPGSPATIEPPAEDLEFDSFDAPVNVFEQPGAGEAPLFAHSELPTAPPLAPRIVPAQAKRSTPAPAQRGRLPFMAETARNPPAPADVLRATRPDRATAARSNAGRRAVEPPPSDPLKDSALDFVNGHEPLLDSLAPMSGLEAPAASPSPPPRAGAREMQECYAVGDFSRALSIAEDILARTPDDVAARRCAQNCRDVLTQMFAARIGPLDQVVRVAISPEEVQWLQLDHRAGFLLSLVDGQSTVDEILDISGMTRLDALKIIFDLTERQVVRLA